ncbi:hypothetical protein AAHS21_23695 [Mycobacterium sp. 050272]|uniref:hypothetical protein n=1 Tax=Mycobacterium sp. 050272 TaxID=3142488 RepID=UPI0031847945
MSSDVERVSREEIDRYRGVFFTLRESAVEASDRAIREIMATNSRVVGQIDAAVGELEPRQDEAPQEHRDRIAGLLADLLGGHNYFPGGT